MKTRLNTFHKKISLKCRQKYALNTIIRADNLMQNIHVELTSANTIDANGRLLIPQTIICGKISFIDLASHYDV